MKRFACMILVMIVLLSWVSIPKLAYATTVSGSITTDTHWKLSDSPIYFSQTVVINAGVTLTIDPGVTVNFQAHTLEIRGTIVAVGTQDQRITFSFGENISGPISSPIFFSPTSAIWNDSANSGCIIQNADFNQVHLYIDSSPKIDSNHFTFSTVLSAISITGSPVITNNRILFTGQDSGHYSNGINVNWGSPVISKNEFEGNGDLVGINIFSQSPTTLLDNSFQNCWSGIKVRGDSIVNIEGNSFVKGKNGIDIGELVSVTLRHNLIDGNSGHGINGGGLIESNTITNNNIGIHNPKAGSAINNNNIVGNTANSVTATVGNVNAQNNWWGTTDIPTIEQTIYDKHEDPTLGEIIFIPIRNTPNPLAPAIPATTPKTTPIPTVNPTQAPIQPTPTPTTLPTFTPTFTPREQKETILKDSSYLLNLDLLTNGVISVLILVWAVVILGYSIKAGVSRYKTKRTLET